MARLLAGLLAVHIADIAAQVTVTEFAPFDQSHNLQVQLTGRWGYGAEGADNVVKFDAPAFEIAFSVTNTSEVEIVLKQEYNVPTAAEGPAIEMEARRAAAVAAAPECVDTGFQTQTFAVYVDGNRQGPIRGPGAAGESSCVFCTFDTGMSTHGEEFTYTVALGLVKNATHEIRIVKDSEADFNNCNTTYENYVTFSKLRLWGAGAALGLPRTANYQRAKIEFVGDAKMTGMCNLCHEGDFDGDARTVLRTSASLAWPKQMCNTLDADCRMTTWSGLGLTSPTNQLDLWDRQLMTIQSSSRSAADDVQDWRADVVIINLAIDDDFVSPSGQESNEFWDRVEETLLNFTVKVRVAYNFNTVVMLACLPTFPTSGDVYCGRARAAARRALDEQEDDSKVWHAVAWDAHGFLTPENQCCGLPDKDASADVATAAIAACNLQRPGTCVHSSAPPSPSPPAPPPAPLSWDKRNPPLVSWLFIGFGVLLLTICALYVGGIPDAPCKKKVDPEAAVAPLAAGR